MNYQIRNTVLWRWCLVTFWISLIVALVKPFGFQVPDHSLWLVPNKLPNWLSWPITNTLFVLSFIWMHTSVLSMALLQKKNRFDDKLLALLQGALIGFIFCQSYSLPFLVIASWVLGVLIELYFGTQADYDRLKRSYGLLAGMIYFYLIITIHGWSNAFDHSIKELVTVFLIQPVQYFLISAILLLALALSLSVLYGSLAPLWWLLRKIWQGLCFTRDILLCVIGLALIELAYFSEDKFHSLKAWLLPRQ